MARDDDAPRYAAIEYPRRRLARGLLRGLGRILMPLLTRTELRGLDHFPEHGPLLVVGNHVATMEAVLMIVYAPWQIEMLGAGDIAPPRWMEMITRIYDFIPVNRGNFDRKAMRQALDLLREGGILGIFPEGGVWDPGAMEAKRGVAWLSYHANAPVLPIGFGGVEGALDKVFKLKRPELVMNVGEVLPPVQIGSADQRRERLQEAANEILAEVKALIPEAYRSQHPEIAEEHFQLTIMALDRSGNEVPIPENRQIDHADGLCKLFYRPWILHIFIKDLGLPAMALQQLDEEPSPEALITALDPILHYVGEENPGFFTYRFGHQWGPAMQQGLAELRDLAAWAGENDYRLRIRAIRRYRISGQVEEIVETEPGPEHVW